MKAELPRKARVSRWDGANVGALPRVSWGDEAIDGVYHVSQGGNQGEFRDDRASMWASPCEFRS